MRDLTADEGVSPCLNRSGLTGPSTIVVLDPAKGACEALRFGDPPVQALAGALCTTSPAVGGVQQEPARLDDRTGRRCELLDEPGQLRPGASWEQRADHPHPGPQPLPPHHDGLAFAIFYPKVHDRLLRPFPAAAQP